MRLPFHLPRMSIRNPFRRRDAERAVSGEAGRPAGQGNAQATSARSGAPSPGMRPAAAEADTPPQYSPAPSFRGVELHPGEIRVQTNFAGVPIGIGAELDFGVGMPLQFRPRRVSVASTAEVSHLDLDASRSSAESPSSPMDVGRILGNPFIANATPVPSRQASLNRGPNDSSFSAPVRLAVGRRGLTAGLARPPPGNRGPGPAFRIY